MIQKMAFTVTGLAPLLMHNGRLAAKDDPFARAMAEISSKRSKVDADYEEMARLEFLGGLYTMETTDEPCIPGYVFEATLIGKGGAARKERQGKEAAANLYVVNDFPLLYDGPRIPDELWTVTEAGGKRPFVHKSLVRVQTSRVTRTRPIFHNWSAHILIEFDTEQLDEATVRRWVEVAGAQVGLCDWRPKFGRFTVEWA